MDKGADQGIFSKTKKALFAYLLKKALLSDISRNLVLDRLNKKLYEEVVDKGRFPKNIRLKKYQYLRSMLECSRRNIDRGFFSKKVAEQVIDKLVVNSMMNSLEYNNQIEKFRNKYNIVPPSFLVISPTLKCNLKCTGCYASADIIAPTLPYEVFDKILDEAYNKMGIRFITISGGEPFMYKDKGKDIFDLFRKYSNIYFLVFTNGTLLNNENCRKLAKLGNVTPAISVEGFEKHTDKRRGKGIYKKVLEAMSNLREVGVPFGASVTATAFNADLLLKNNFYDYYFKKQGITYMWMFQLMPIGQAKDMEKCMITPNTRLRLFKKWEEMLSKRNYCIADFWNSGLLSNGCIAYGKDYFYIDWNGNIMPCVFVPYYEDNIIDLYRRGKSLSDALLSDLFKNGRKWQEDYGSCHDSPGNWLMPCSIRDHWKNFKENILTKKSKPEDRSAELALNSKEYSKTLEKFDKKLERLTVPIWKKRFLK